MSVLAGPRLLADHEQTAPWPIQASIADDPADDS